MPLLLTLFRMGLFGAAHGWGSQKGPLPKFCHTYPTMMKLGTVIPYLKKMQKIYKSRDTSLEFCWMKSIDFDLAKHILVSTPTHACTGWVNIDWSGAWLWLWFEWVLSSCGFESRCSQIIIYLYFHSIKRFFLLFLACNHRHIA